MAEQTLRVGDDAFRGSGGLLRRALWLDAIVSGAFGLLGLVATGWLSTRFGLPEGLLRGTAVVMVPWVVVLATLATRATIASAAVNLVIAFNLLWVVASAGLLLSGAVSPTTLGTLLVLVQAAGVALFAALQYAGSRRDR
jgi:hypothetical protein